MSSRYSRTTAAIILGVFIGFGLLSSWLRQTIAQISEKEILLTQQLQLVPPVVSGIENLPTQTLTVGVEQTAQPNLLTLTWAPLSSEFNKQADRGLSSIINVPLDIVLLQDETSSMRDDIGNMNRLSPEIWDSISTIAQAGFQMSVIGFRDFDRHPWGTSGDWVFRRYQDFTISRTMFTQALGRLTALGGNDVPESQYAALYYLLSSLHSCIDSNGDGDCTDVNDTASAQQPNFRSGAKRVILLATDAPFHEPTATTNYPGPSKDLVISALLENRAILIGLVPGGAGKIPQVDELAALTGGSVQNTGATGNDVANAIATALASIRPVSAELSTVESSTNSVPADGSVAMITAILRNTAGIPVSGKTVRFQSNRPGDLIVQPTALTDEGGRATGRISSITVGASTISTVDVTDNVQVSKNVFINFTGQSIPPNQALLQRIDMLDRMSYDSLSRLASITRDVGVEGDKFVADFGADVAEAATSAFLGFMNQLKIRADAAPSAVRYTYPGVQESGWSGILDLKQHYPRGGKLFNNLIQNGIQTGKWSGLTLTMVQSGIKFYVASFRDEAVEEVTTKALIETMRQIILSVKDGLTTLGKRGSDAIADLQLSIREKRNNLTSGIPPMSDTQQSAYAEDLYRRTIVPMVLANIQEHQANLLKNLRAAHDSVDTDGVEYFALKFLASNLALAAFDGVGQALVDGFTTSFEVYLNGRKAAASWRAFMAVPSILKGSAESAASIYSNTTNGYQRILSQLPSRPITGKVTNIQQFSQGEYWGFVYWKEDTTYTEFELTNTTGEQADFDILIEYGYDSELFGLPWAFIPLVKSETVSLAPNETKQMRLYFKRGAEGGSPEQDTWVRIDVLAGNNTGMFFIDSDTRYWSPQRVTLAGTVIAANEMAADTLVIENPIDMYVLGDPNQQIYEAQIWISNPFSQPITVLVNQPLAVDIVTASTVGNIQDSTIQWTQTVQPRDVISLSFQFQRSGIPGETLSLPPATMSFVEPTSGVALTAHSNSPSFTIQSPVELNAYTPLHVYGNESTLPVTVTNYLDKAVNGSVMVEVIGTDATQLSTETKSFSTGAKANQLLPFRLPGTLPPGVYKLQVWLVTSGVQNLVLNDTLLVKGVLGLSGDCNADRFITASDVTALALEFFDGDDNSNPLGTSGGTYAGSPACDANEDSRIGASDVTCIARLFFNGPGACRTAVTTASVANPALAMPQQIPAVAGGQVAVPITLNSHGAAVGSLLFSVDYDETWLHFDPTDGDGNGSPDAITAALPAEFVHAVTFDPTDTDGELDFVVSNFAATPLALTDGQLLTVTFQIGQPPTDTAAVIRFAQSPGAAFGDPQGQELTGDSVDGAVSITLSPDMPKAKSFTYLPLITHTP